jgi:pSer/pThr/pTyr-binding forkhead associated (FHA) protein
MAKLLLFLQDGSAREVLLEKGSLTVGRRNDNDVPLHYPTVSGRHATFTYDPIKNACFVEDAKSTNGTLLNGKLLAQAIQLKDRDQIDVGGQKFVFLEGTPSAKAAAPAKEIPSKPETPIRLASRHELMSNIAALQSQVAEMPPAPAPTHQTATLPNEKQTYKHKKKTTVEDFEENHSGLFFPTIFRIPTKIPLIPGEESDDRIPNASDSVVADNALADGGAILEEAQYTQPPAVAMLEAMSGPNSQRKLMLRVGEYVIGRPGFQLAVVRVSDDGCRLFPMEGEPPLYLRDEIVSADGALLQDQDTFTVGKSPLQFRVVPASAQPSEA